MYLKRIPIIVTATLLLSTSLAFALTHTSPNYILKDARIVISGGDANSSNYFLDGVRIGNVFGGKAESGNFSLDASKIVRGIPYPPPTLSVSVSPDFWNIGVVEVNSITMMGDAGKITVTNDGQVRTTYALSLVNPQGWTASQTEIGQNIYILNAAFSLEAESIVWNETNHALSTEQVRSTSTKFAGDQTGVDVAPNEERTLWLQFKAPSATVITTQQDIEVIINAQVP